MINNIVGLLPCYLCSEMNQDNGYCYVVKDYLLIGYAKFYFSQRCGKAPTVAHKDIKEAKL